MADENKEIKEEAVPAEGATSAEAVPVVPKKEEVEREVLLNFNASEFVETKKNLGWYLVIGVVFLALVAYAVYRREWSMLAVFVIVVVVLFQFSFNKPRMIDVEISNLDIVVGKIKYNFTELTSYWIGGGQTGGSTLYLKKKTKIAPIIAVRLGDQNPDKIKELLTKYLKLEPGAEQEDLVDKVARFFRF